MLAESIGVEPIHPLLDEGLAIPCLNRSANSPKLGAQGETRTLNPRRRRLLRPQCIPFHHLGKTLKMVRLARIELALLEL